MCGIMLRTTLPANRISCLLEISISSFYFGAFAVGQFEQNGSVLLAANRLPIISKQQSYWHLIGSQLASSEAIFFSKKSLDLNSPAETLVTKLFISLNRSTIFAESRSEMG